MRKGKNQFSTVSASITPTTNLLIHYILSIFLRHQQ